MYACEYRTEQINKGYSQDIYIILCDRTATVACMQERDGSKSFIEMGGISRMLAGVFSLIICVLFHMAVKNDNAVDKISLLT